MGKNTVAIVTGGAVGYKTGGPSIGSEICFQLSKEGNCVSVIDVNEKSGRETAERIVKSGGNAIFIKCDVSDEKQVIAAVEKTAKSFGRIDYLVNCAASYEGDMHRNVVELDTLVWKRIIDVNLGGYFLFAKHSIPKMLENGRGGSIVNISSVWGHSAGKNEAVYCTTKAAILNLTKSIAIDFAPKIRCNSVSPGFVRIENSEGKRKGVELDKWIRSFSEDYPLGRVATVSEIANVVSFLLSSKSSFITGTDILVDGGKTATDAPRPFRRG
ncbi:MAG: SDR family oxidoreductase [archaeon]